MGDRPVTLHAGRREIFLITTLRASATPNPGQLIYETQANRSTTYRWPGKHGLILYDVAFQNRAAEKKDEPEPEKPLAVQVSETIERAMGSLRSNITQIGICILILLGAILITLWHVR
jgi:hypothetical protein